MKVIIYILFTEDTFFRSPYPTTNKLLGHKKNYLNTIVGTSYKNPGFNLFHTQKGKR